MSEAKKNKDPLLNKYVKTSALAKKYRKQLKKKYARRIRPKVVKKLSK